MPRANVRSVFRYFSYDIDAEEEELYLSGMGRKGFVLCGFSMDLLYRFREIRSCELTYRIDYRDRRDDDYLRLVRDAGWELAALRRCRGGVFYYFYKAVGSDCVVELYSDNNSKLDMYRRMRKRAVFSMAIIALLCLAAAILFYILKSDSHFMHFIAGLIMGILGVSFVLAIFVYRKVVSKISHIEDSEL